MEEKARLKQLEFHIANNCNLNCDSCNHFCNLEKGNSFPNYKDVHGDLCRIKTLFEGGIELMYLVGGEPFLNPDLSEYCILARYLFPDTKIIVITNGILLLKDSVNETLKVMANNNIELLISKYPINLHDLDSKLSSFANLKYSYTNEIIDFTKRLTLNNDNDAKKSYEHCHEKICHYLENGKLYGCTLFGRVKKLNEEFGTNYPDVGIDIYKAESGEEINKQLENVYPYCSYCSCTYDYVKWSCGKQVTLDDFIVKKPNKNIFMMKLKRFLSKVFRG